MKNILFVCSGNTCRSPIAEGLARRLLAGAAPFGLRVASAGTSAIDGQQASAHAIDVAGRRGIDLSGHRARHLDATMVRRADLIVTMGEKHRETVGVIEPEALTYTVRLTDFSDTIEGDIADPIGGDEAAYEATFDAIRRCVESMARALPRFDGWRSDRAGEEDS